MHQLRRRTLVALAALAPLACQRSNRPQGSPSAAPLPRLAPGSKPPTSAHIDGVPHIRQKPDFCGEAAAAAYLQKLGAGYDQDAVFAMTGMDPARGMGATTRELTTGLRRIGFGVGEVWHHVGADAPEQLVALFNDMVADLGRGVPSIVCMRYDDAPATTEHFRLVLGFDAERDEVVYHEPAEDNAAYQRMSRAVFMSLWPLKYEADRWTVIRLRLEPETIAAPPTFTSHTPADFAQHVRQLKTRAPAGFSIVVQPPFVVIGDGGAERVQRSASGTVRWAVEKLKAAYFSKDPQHILDIWLFKDAASYEHHNVALWGEEPSTPYGFYSESDRALVMNIATGGGTLVHEIVHPFVEANFPRCPAWFNEGLGSLYEQSAERDGGIVGLTNWRLAGLQRAIRASSVPSFRALTATSTNEFYNHDPGTNYAQARYLLYYLQERGLLNGYYHRFVAAAGHDPTGYTTLVETLGNPNMKRFQAEWQAWVLELRFG